MGEMGELVNEQARRASLVSTPLGSLADVGRGSRLARGSKQSEHPSQLVTAVLPRPGDTPMRL